MTMPFSDQPYDTLTVPSDAAPTDPQIMIGADIPAELLAEYGTGIKAVVVYRLNASVYAYTAVIEAAPDPYRVEGIVNTVQAAGSQVAEVYRFYYPTGGGTRPQLWFSSALLNSIVFDAGSDVSFYDRVTMDNGLTITGGGLTVSDGVTVSGRSQGRGMVAQTILTANSAAIGAAETVITTLNNVTFQQGRAYRIVPIGGLFGSAAGNLASVLCRLGTTVAGAIVADFLWTRVEAALVVPPPASEGIGLVRRTAGVGDLTSSIVLTLRASAGTVQQYADVTGYRNRGLRVVDVGAAADFPDAYTL